MGVVTWVWSTSTDHEKWLPRLIRAGRPSQLTLLMLATAVLSKLNHYVTLASYILS